MADLLDTSVLIAFILGERHDVDPDALLGNACISAVNRAEAKAVLLQKGIPEDRIDLALSRFPLKVLPFGEAEANITSRLISLGRPLNIGLGDCACIATGIVHGHPVWTADRDWLKLETTADIRLIR